MPWRSSWVDNTLPPNFVTAPDTRCSSVAPAMVIVAPSRNAEPDGIVTSLEGPRFAAGWRPSSCSSMIAADTTLVALTDDVYDRGCHGEQQHHHEADIDRRRQDG